MAELTILYAGCALAGKRESIVQLAKQFPSASLEIIAPEPQVQMPALAIASERVSLRLTARSGAVAAFDLDRRLSELADAIVFVIDSQRERWDANVEARDNLAAAVDLQRLPLVFQANRRDFMNRMPVAELARLDRWGAPIFESVAPRGIGVWRPFETVARMLGQRHDLDAEVRALLAQRRA